MNYLQWQQLADILTEHLDPADPENVEVWHIAAEEMEIDFLRQQAVTRPERFPAW